MTANSQPSVFPHSTDSIAASGARQVYGLSLLVSSPTVCTHDCRDLAGGPLGPSFLTIEQRQARDAYWANKRGLQFGVPSGAYPRALAQMRGMRQAPTR